MTETAYAGKAKDYSAYRLPYALEAVEALCESVGLEDSWAIADIGSGTGNVSRHIVGRVARVFAVEPDDAMRHEAEQLLGRHSGFTSIAGVAEATTLQEQSVDLITVGQALHWFNAERTHAEFNRILRADEWLALLWNRFGPEGDPDLSAFFRQDEGTRASFPVTIQENWTQFIGGARSAPTHPIEATPDTTSLNVSKEWYSRLGQRMG